MSRRSKRVIGLDKIIQDVSVELSLPIDLVRRVVQAEQQATLIYLKHNYKIVKRGYMTLVPMLKSEYQMKSYFDNVTYHIPNQPLVRIRLGRTLLEDLKK